MTAELRKLSVTVPLRSAPPPAESLITVFHRWVQRDHLVDQLLIDVVDYRHVHQGPGILLVAHEAYYSVGAHGLRVSSRRDESDSFAGALRLVYLRALRAAALLEAEPSLAPLRFASERIEIASLDRLRAPTAGELAAASAAVLEPITGALDITQPGDDPRGPAQIAASAAQPASLRDLIDGI